MHVSVFCVSVNCKKKEIKVNRRGRNNIVFLGITSHCVSRSGFPLISSPEVTGYPLQSFMQ
jgi:hypothetical protein